MIEQFSSYEWVEGTFTFMWKKHHYQDQLMEGIKKISQNETTEILLNDLRFCALARLYKTFKKAVTSLDFSALTVEFKRLTVDCP